MVAIFVSVAAVDTAADVDYTVTVVLAIAPANFVAVAVTFDVAIALANFYTPVVADARFKWPKSYLLIEPFNFLQNE